MGKVQKAFYNGFPGTVTRSLDDVIISVPNGASEDIPFGAPVFLQAGKGMPFSTSSPQDFTAFLGFAVRVADKTPETYSDGQFPQAQPDAAWKAGDLMEVLVRGSVALTVIGSGARGSGLYIRKSDGALTTNAGAEGSTLLLENVRVRNPHDAGGCCEAVVNKRNII